MTTATIRPGTMADAPQLMPLMKQLGYPQTNERIKAQIQAYSTVPQHLLIAETNEKIIGLIAFVIYELFVVDGKRCRIEGLVVDANHRGQGVGHKLVQTAEAFAKTQGCRIIDLTSGLRRAKDGSHNFYKSLNYHNDGPMAKLYLRKEL